TSFILLIGLLSSATIASGDWKSHVAKRAIGRVAQEAIEEAIEDGLQDAVFDESIEWAAGEAMEAAMEAADVADSIDNALDVAEAARKVHKAAKVIKKFKR